MSDPFALEVHRPVQSEDAPAGLPALPTYVPRDHDTELERVVRATAGGGSGVAVLVGGSSTGKTRACWEALGLLRDQDPPWRVWHPIDPSRPDAALAELPRIGPRTVVWLNEAQFYLDVTEAGLGEQVAAGLRELLRDAGRGPVLVLATLWPGFWDALTARPDGGPEPHAQARELLAGHDITVPAAFTPAQMAGLAGAGDVRLALAARSAAGGQVVQFLAGAPELLARYRNAPPAARAVIEAAMDARRLGMGAGLPRAFLAAAAPGYLTDDEWDAPGDDWLEQALASTARPAKGVRGPLTGIRPRPARSSATGSGAQDSDEQVAGGPASTPGGPLYRLADYLDQHGRAHRKGQIPPADFWAAAADHAFPADQAVLGDAAHARGLYRDAAQLHKNAAARGNPHAVSYLSNTPDYFRGDDRPALWAAAHAPVDDPRLVAALLGSLLQAGAQEHVTALAERAAAQVPVDDPTAVARLLDSMRRAGAQGQVIVLAGRAAAHVPVDPLSVARSSDSDPRPVAGLLDRMREAGAHEQVAALAERAAAQVSLDDTAEVAWWLFMPSRGLLPLFAPEQVTALLRRDPAAHASLGDPAAVAQLLDRLREAGAPEQVTVLAGRAASQVPSMTRPRWPRCLIVFGRRTRTSKSPSWPGGPPRRFPSMTRPRWPRCWTACGRRARRSRSLRCCAVIPPRRSPSTSRSSWPSCWPGCGMRARRSRSPHWPGGPPRTSPSTARSPYSSCSASYGRRARTSRSPSWPGGPPRTSLSTTRPRWPGCWTACSGRGRGSWSPCFCAVIPPPTSAWTTWLRWPSCWTACGRRARRSRSLRCCVVIPPPTSA